MNRRSIGHDIKPCCAEEWLLRLQRMVKGGSRLHHPWINLFREYRDRYEQEKHRPREQCGNVLAEPPDWHRPSRIEQMMHQHQEQCTQANAEIEHERPEPGIGEFLTVRDQSDQRQKP